MIDARSPAEFADDHIPGARNFPTLDDAERAEIGTLSATESGFAAKRKGAIYAARNIARHIESEFVTRPPGWRPAIYCWRGGKRSRSMTLVLREIGWAAAQLEGGYKAFRRQVVSDLAAWPAALRTITVCGETGTAKSRLIAALAARGAQALDLEALAAHRGSVLGAIPGAPQPSQKRFDTLVWDALRKLDRARPLYIEGESKKIGRLQVPAALVVAMRSGECVRVHAPVAARVQFLLAEYAHLVRDPAHLHERIESLAALYPRERIAGWHALVDAADWPAFVAGLLAAHYDPAYRRSLARNFARLAEAPAIELRSLDPGSVGRAADELIARHGR